MKILYVCNDLQFFTNHFSTLVKRSIESGHQVTALVGGVTPTSAERLEAMGCRLRSMSLSRSGVNPLGELHLLLEIAKVISEGRYDLVHLFTIKPCIYGGIVARLFGVRKVVATVTGLGYAFSGKGGLAYLRGRILILLYKVAFGGKGRGVRMVFENTDDRMFFQSEGVVCPDRSAQVWGAGVDLGRFSPADTPIYEVGASRPVDVLLPSRMLRDKGVIEFIEAARCLKLTNVPVRMILAGDVDSGNPASLSAEDIESAVSEGVVDWLGYCDDMPCQLRSADIVCLPSYREGMPKVLLEAMASGKPIITTDAPGCREAIEHGIEGVLVSARNSQSLVEAISELVSAPQTMIEMGLASRRRAELLFGDTNIADKYIAIYDEL